MIIVCQLNLTKQAVTNGCRKYTSGIRITYFIANNFISLFGVQGGKNF